MVRSQLYQIYFNMTILLENQHRNEQDYHQEMRGGSLFNFMRIDPSATYRQDVNFLSIPMPYGIANPPDIIRYGIAIIFT